MGFLVFLRTVSALQDSVSNSFDLMSSSLRFLGLEYAMVSFFIIILVPSGVGWLKKL